MVDPNLKRVRMGRGNVPHSYYAIHVVKQIVKEIEAGEISIEEAHDKYSVSRVTVVNWMKRHSVWNEDEYIHQRPPTELKRRVVQQIEQGILTRKEATKKYKVDSTTIGSWLKLYSCEVKIILPKMQERAQQDIYEISLIEHEKAGLKTAVTELKLKVAALETMIEIAEKEYKINIRKKSGTKQ
jgi:transposase